ncbi:Yip1 family protein [Natrinema caseinilyticum]|uniref:Yip1 family protein n=1 Tax=Natrinema caseinilyticum TaxID=2961570 RepID=UPI0020C4FD9B|nr:Yip1 family protein [Natrinema caseinilyticum]
MDRNLIFDPHRFFDQESRDPRLLPPVLTVLLTGILLNMATVLLLPKLTQTLPSENQMFATVITLLGVVGSIAGIFVLWFIYAGVFHTISVYFDGEGDFRTVFLLTGWGFFPLVLNGLFAALMLQYTLQGITVPQDPAQLDNFIRGLESRTPILFSSVLRIPLLIWQAAIWTLAVKYARSLTIKEAIVTVSLPTLLTFAYNLYELYGVVFA